MIARDPRPRAHVPSTLESLTRVALFAGPCGYIEAEDGRIVVERRPPRAG